MKKETMTLEQALEKYKLVLADPNSDYTGYLKYLRINFPNDRERITDCIAEDHHGFIERTKKELDAISVRIQLKNSVDVLPMSYIAENYFHRSRQWLYQRINGNIVNGKPAKFTAEEKKIFNRAVKDISKKIGAIKIV